MDKPFDMQVTDLMDNLMEVYKNSRLPVSVANLVVQDFSRNINEATKIMMERQKQDYLLSLEKEKES